MQTKPICNLLIKDLNPELGHLDLSEDLTSLVNRVYQEDEAGIWKDGATRTHVSEVRELIKKGELAAGFINDNLVGVIRIQMIDHATGEFGMLAVEPKSRNAKIGSQLVDYAEKRCALMGASTMQLELLVPNSWTHRFKEYLKEWYTRIGYIKIYNGSIKDSYPQLEPLLGTTCNFEVYHKSLNNEVFSDNKQVLNANRLTRKHLEKLFSGEILGIRITKYYDPDQASAAAADIVSRDDLEEYYYEVSDQGEIKRTNFGVSRFGVSFNTTFHRIESGPEFTRYHQSALRNIRRLRSLFAPSLSPIDQFRLELDEIWPGGASIGEFSGSKMFTGIGRVTHPNADILENRPHADILPPNFSLESQYSANIYLTTPDENLGGELLLWDETTLNHESIGDLNKNPDLWRERLGPPILIAPQPGDLIIINTRRPHAVRVFQKGSRVTIQTFFGQEKDGGLRLWC